MNSVVVDASVALKWFLKKEKDRDKARLLLRQFADGKIKFIVPSLWLYEIANAFKNNIYQKMISKVTAKRYLRQVKDLDIVSVDFEPIVDTAFNLSVKLGISVYDAAYISLSKSQNLPFYTADQKLLDKIPVSFKKVYSLAKLDTKVN